MKIVANNLVRSFNTRTLMLVMLIVATFSFSVHAADRADATPQTSSPERIGTLISKLPQYAHFSISGLAFYDGKLFASSNIGLITLNGATPTSIYKWYPNDDVVEGPWQDNTSGALWLQRVHDMALIRLDAKGWHLIGLPKSPGDFYSRGDFLEGFNGVSETDGFRLQGAGHVWKFDDATAGNWRLQSSPPAPQFSSMKAIGHLEGHELYILSIGSCFSWSRNCSYEAYWREGDDWSQPIKLPNCCVKDVVSADDGVYIRISNGSILQITRKNMSSIELPGAPETIARSSAGNLIAAFANVGIYVWSEHNWKKIADDPSPQKTGNHWNYLAEQDGIIAYAIVPKPELDSNNRPEYGRNTELWISKEHTWKSVDFNGSGK